LKCAGHPGLAGAAPSRENGTAADDATPEASRPTAGVAELNDKRQRETPP